MTKQEISEEAKQEVKRLLEDNSNPSIRTSVLAANLSIFMEENEDLKNHIENIKEEIQILTGDLRASADALDDLD
jgi:hypothetical protein